MTKTHVKKLRFLHKKSTQKKHKKKQPGATVIADSRLQVLLFFSDVLESR